MIVVVPLKMFPPLEPIVAVPEFVNEVVPWKVVPLRYKFAEETVTLPVNVFPVSRYTWAPAEAELKLMAVEPL
jgi:hypothetical protein